MDFQLSAWHAEPLTQAAAQALLNDVRISMRKNVIQNRQILALRLQEMIARFWLGYPIVMMYETLIAQTWNDNDRALIELVYGQLLMSKKLQGASVHLHKGFGLARKALGPEEYFLLMNRHNLLDFLVLSKTPATGQNLQTLLNEAGVIQRLQAGRGKSRPAATDNEDTIG